MKFLQKEIKLDLFHIRIELSNHTKNIHSNTRKKNNASPSVLEEYFMEVMGPGW